MYKIVAVTPFIHRDLKGSALFALIDKAKDRIISVKNPQHVAINKKLDEFKTYCCPIRDFSLATLNNITDSLDTTKSEVNLLSIRKGIRYDLLVEMLLVNGVPSEEIASEILDQFSVIYAEAIENGRLVVNPYCYLKQSAKPTNNSQWLNETSSLLGGREHYVINNPNDPECKVDVFLFRILNDSERPGDFYYNFEWIHNHPIGSISYEEDQEIFDQGHLFSSNDIDLIKGGGDPLNAIRRPSIVCSKRGILVNDASSYYGGMDGSVQRMIVSKENISYVIRSTLVGIISQKLDSNEAFKQIPDYKKRIIALACTAYLRGEIDNDKFKTRIATQIGEGSEFSKVSNEDDVFQVLDMQYKAGLRQIRTWVRGLAAFYYSRERINKLNEYTSGKLLNTYSMEEVLEYLRLTGPSYRELLRQKYNLSSVELSFDLVSNGKKLLSKATRDIVFPKIVALSKASSVEEARNLAVELDSLLFKLHTEGTL